MTKKRKKRHNRIRLRIIISFFALAIVFFLMLGIKGFFNVDKAQTGASDDQQSGASGDQQSGAAGQAQSGGNEGLSEVESSYKPLLDKTYSDIGGDEALNALNGYGYWDSIPDVGFGVCTGYVGWAMVNVYGVPDYPHSVSTVDNRNGGEWVDAHRMWLMEHAAFIGCATTENGTVTYHGGSYMPGDIIIFNNQRDCDEGELVQSTSNPSSDYWGRYGEAFFTHVAIVGADNTLYEENLEEHEFWEAGGTLPEGQYNMHHNTGSLGGIRLALSPEQFITRDVPDDNMDYSRSYEVYRVLKMDNIAQKNDNGY
ncbi:MAG: hypothetical protein J5928_00115 [Firmicutes bacterium]|nr:hypothetical protein [Bacillota bacterium]